MATRVATLLTSPDSPDIRYIASVSVIAVFEREQSRLNFGPVRFYQLQNQT